MRKHYFKSGKYFAVILAAALTLSLAGCKSKNSSEKETLTEETASVMDAEVETPGSAEVIKEIENVPDYSDTVYLSKADIKIDKTIENSTDGEHATATDGTQETYSNTEVIKTGEADGDEADFYGENSAIFATNKATLNLSNMVIETNGTHANAVFSYGEGTTVNISDSVIETEGNCSGGLMTTGGGTMNAENLTIYTTGNSSAAIRSDRGGGTVTVTGGSYTTEGTGSPVVYSTADITVKDAYMESTASQGIVVEGKNSVSLEGVELVADNNTKNSDKSDTYQAVMIYQSMSGDAAEGAATFSMKNSSLSNNNGDIFFVNNTSAEITLESSKIVNQDNSGLFLRAAAAGWGNDGSNGGNVNMYLKDQIADGDIIVDSISTLNLYLSDESELNGAINTEGQAGDVYVELKGDSTWTLAGDSYIKSLTCDENSINLNGYTLYVDGKQYTEGSASEGSAVSAKVSTGNSAESGAPEGAPGAGPDGTPEGTPPEKPDGAGEAPNGAPPEKPDGAGETPNGAPPEKPE